MSRGSRAIAARSARSAAAKSPAAGFGDAELELDVRFVRRNPGGRTHDSLPFERTFRQPERIGKVHHDFEPVRLQRDRTAEGVDRPVEFAQPDADIAKVVDTLPIGRHGRDRRRIGPGRLVEPALLLADISEHARHLRIAATLRTERARLVDPARCEQCGGEISAGRQIRGCGGENMAKVGKGGIQDRPIAR